MAGHHPGGLLLRAYLSPRRLTGNFDAGKIGVRLFPYLARLRPSAAKGDPLAGSPFLRPARITGG